mgnify:CR=1 FL=1
MISLNPHSPRLLVHQEPRATQAQGKDSFVLAQPVEKNQGLSPVTVLPMVVSLALVLGATILLHGRETPGAKLIDLRLRGTGTILRVSSQELPQLTLLPRKGSHIAEWPAFQIGELDHALTTGGMSVCCAVGAAAGREQYLGHIFPLTKIETLVRHFREVGIERMKGELGIVPGWTADGTVSLNVLTAFGEIHPDLRSRVQFYHFPEGVELGQRTVFLYQGRLFRPFFMFRDYRTSHQMIPE